MFLECNVVDNLIPGDISHVQYANDIVIMIDASVLNLKLILHCFEWLSGIKIIIFTKVRGLFFWMAQEEKERTAKNMLLPLY